MLEPWFEAHKTHRMEATFVVSVKFAASVRIFLTGTNKGEVKLWSNLHCECLGVLNSNNWDPTKVLRIIEEANKEERRKELLRDDSIVESTKRRIRLKTSSMSPHKKGLY